MQISTSLIIAAALFGQAEGGASQDAAADYRTAFMGAMRAAMTGDWEGALPAAETALPLAQTPIERYQIRHVLTDINSRLHHWEEAGRWASEAAAVIHSDPGLTEARIVMASHMAAEEGRAAAMLGDEARVADANARMIADHPDAAPGWRAEGTRGAVHTGGLSCDLLVEDYLRFDVYGGAEGAAACMYWNHSDIGMRLTDGDQIASEIARLHEEHPGIAPRETEFTAGDAIVQAFDLGQAHPSQPQQYALVVQSGDRILTAQFPTSATEEARDSVAYFLAQN